MGRFLILVVLALLALTACGTTAPEPQKTNAEGLPVVIVYRTPT